MGLVLATVKFGKEEAAGIEILDCILPYDLNARLIGTGFGGVLLLETSMEPDRTARILMEFPTSLIQMLIPVDKVVNAEMGEIRDAILQLAGRDPKKFAVKCVRRGRAISSSKDVEVSIGSALKQQGHVVDLDNPELIARIDLIGERAAISVKSPELQFKKNQV
jgi:tRNA(Ser,Leu) C12 N-acetylase TAN1